MGIALYAYSIHTTILETLLEVPLFILGFVSFSYGFVCNIDPQEPPLNY